MAYKAILGHDGVTPVLIYGGTKPVIMTSPCPFSQWDALAVSADQAVWSSSGSGASGSARLTSNTSAGYFTGTRDLKMLSKGYGTISAVLTRAGTFSSWFVRLTTWVGATKVGDVSWTDTLTGTLTLTPPYYRYRIRVYCQATTGVVSGNWLNVAFTLS